MQVSRNIQYKYTYIISHYMYNVILTPTKTSNSCIYTNIMYIFEIKF